jgi:uncharacterized protein DUF6457
MDWLEQLAAALGLDPLEPDETNDLLDAARDVAHGVERKITPLASFLLGMSVAARMERGSSRPDAIRGTLTDLRRLLPA